MPDVRLSPSEGEGVKAALWAKYCREMKADPVRQAEHKKKALAFRGATMRYEYQRIGAKPDGGYPLYIALHGGGGAPAGVNDSQWRHMQVYYRSGVKQGIYVAPRGVSNTWNLHFRGESYPLYDRLIENLVVFEEVDPDRVYLLGFSAGGDGTYQTAARMADRWAAANMSAGHHNNVSPRNLYHVAFLIQVGERDGAYGRNKASVQYYQRLLALRKQEHGGYVAEMNLHADRPHNFLDNEPKGVPQSVIADPVAWLEGGERRVVKRDTNAIHWLDKHTRTPHPKRLIWDLATGADRSGRDAKGKTLWARPRGRSHYWLSVDDLGDKELGAKEIVAACDRASQTVTVEKAGTYLRVLLSGDMLDLSKPVTLDVMGQKLSVRVEPSLGNLVATLRSRGDRRLMFEGAVTLRKKDGRWHAGPSTERDDAK